jgi:hypothetical protein
VEPTPSARFSNGSVSIGVTTSKHKIPHRKGSSFIATTKELPSNDRYSSSTLERSRDLHEDNSPAWVIDRIGEKSSMPRPYIPDIRPGLQPSVSNMKVNNSSKLEGSAISTNNNMSIRSHSIGTSISSVESRMKSCPIWHIVTPEENDEEIIL